MESRYQSSFTGNPADRKRGSLGRLLGGSGFRVRLASKLTGLVYWGGNEDELDEWIVKLNEAILEAKSKRYRMDTRLVSAGEFQVQVFLFHLSLFPILGVLFSIL